MTAFDPADWLRELEDCGGWYILTGDNEIHTGFPFKNEEDALRAKRLIAQLDSAPGYREAVRALIRKRCLIG